MKNKTATIIADIKNINLGDKIIFDILSKQLTTSGYNKVIKISNRNKKTGNIEFIHYMNAIRVIYSLSRSEKIYIGGGGILQDRTSIANIIYFWLMSELALLLNRSTELISIGATPTTNWLTRKLIKRICNNAQQISVRDIESKHFLSDLCKKPIKVTDDLALHFTTPIQDISLSLNKFKIPSKYILFALRPCLATGTTTKNNNWNNQLANEIRKICTSSRCMPVFTVFHTQQDLDFAKSIAKKINIESYKIIQNMSANDFCQLAYASEKVIAMRLHAVILSKLCNKHCIAISYDTKVRNFGKQHPKAITTLSTNEVIKLSAIYSSTCSS